MTWTEVQILILVSLKAVWRTLYSTKSIGIVFCTNIQLIFFPEPKPSSFFSNIFIINIKSTIWLLNSLEYELEIGLNLENGLLSFPQFVDSVQSVLKTIICYTSIPCYCVVSSNRFHLFSSTDITKRWFPKKRTLLGTFYFEKVKFIYSKKVTKFLWFY